MSNKTITELPEVTAITATDVIPIVQNNVTSRILASKFEEKTNILTTSAIIDDQPFTVPNNDYQQIIFRNTDKVENGVTIQANGNILFSELGTYTANIKLSVARQGSAGDGGTCVIGIIPHLDGTAYWGATAINLPNFASIQPIELNIKFEVKADVNIVQIYMVRDNDYSAGAGLTQGGLYNYNIGNVGGNDEPTQSAQITISKVG